MTSIYMPNCLLFGREQAFYEDYKSLHQKILDYNSEPKPKFPLFCKVRQIWKSSGFYFIHTCVIKKEIT